MPTIFKDQHRVVSAFSEETEIPSSQSLTILASGVQERVATWTHNTGPQGLTFYMSARLAKKTLLGADYRAEITRHLGPISSAMSQVACSRFSILGAGHEDLL